MGAVTTAGAVMLALALMVTTTGMISFASVAAAVLRRRPRGPQTRFAGPAARNSDGAAVVMSLFVCLFD